MVKQQNTIYFLNGPCKGFFIHFCCHQTSTVFKEIEFAGTQIQNRFCSSFFNAHVKETFNTNIVLSFLLQKKFYQLYYLL